MHCDCPKCDLRLKYPSKWRTKNLRLLNEHTPEKDISTVIISESPPYNGTYIYDPCSECYPKKFSYHVFMDLGYIRPNDGPIDETMKETLLLRMKEDGIIVLDCCHCAVNHLRGFSRMSERDGRVLTCFESFAHEALASIHQKYEPEMRFKFPSGRGNGLYRTLKDEFGSKIRRIPY